MSVAEIKNDLILQILQTEDESVLEILGAMFRSLNEGKDWWAELTKKQRELIRQGSEQIERGQVVPDAMVRAKARQILGKP
ncbi:MAG: hypothetical protein ACKV1O_17550 [Saprospiraceae bacterium]